MRSIFIIALLLQALHVSCFNFPWESVQLTEDDIKGNPDLAFGVPPQSSAPFPTNTTNSTACKTYQGNPLWPTDAEWESFNTTLNGALIKPLPPAASCYTETYDTAKCAYVTQNYFNSTFHTDDPISVMSSWTEGSTCDLPFSFFGNVTANNGNCTMDGYPSYVVKAETVRQVQMAVNFARNRGLRLVIKNTGHDFLGKSTGGGALSIWTHNLKSTEFIPDFEIGDYKGKAARLAAGLESYEIHAFMTANNVTIVLPGGTTVGGVGGFMQGGGHSVFTSLYGLAADNVLSIEVVTADGKFIHVDQDNNEDLFFAIRGGGGGTWGVVTSVIMKAHPITPMSTSSISFSTGPPPPPFPFNLTNATFPAPPPTVTVPRETFWAALRTYLSYAPAIVDAGGIGYTYLSRGFAFPGSNTTVVSLTFTVSLEMPLISPSDLINFSAPLIADLNKIGLNITTPTPTYTSAAVGFTSPPLYPGEGAGGGSRMATRLIPRRNFENATLLNKTVDAFRYLVEEGGYSMHAINYSPSRPTSPENGVNPALRGTVMHAESFDSSFPATEEGHKTFNRFFDRVRESCPGAGAYLNEADVEEPGWQQAFYGGKYERLLGVKRERDPWGLFWVPTGVGSEGWRVEVPGGGPTQNGRLCRVGG